MHTRPTPNGSPLEGTWRTGNVTVADMTAVLSRAGLQKWIQPFRAEADLGHSNAFLLTIANGVWHEGWSTDGGPFVDNDDGAYRIAGDTVTYYPQGPSATYRWSIQGGTLRLTLIRNIDTYPGIPDEVLPARVLHGRAFPAAEMTWPVRDALPAPGGRE